MAGHDSIWKDTKLLLNAIKQVAEFLTSLADKKAEFEDKVERISRSSNSQSTAIERRSVSDDDDDDLSNWSSAYPRYFAPTSPYDRERGKRQRTIEDELLLEDDKVYADFVDANGRRPYSDNELIDWARRNRM